MGRGVIATDRASRPEQTGASEHVHTSHYIVHVAERLHGHVTPGV